MNKIITMGSDCSGIGAPEQAMSELGVPHRIVFASEKDKFARRAYNLIHKPEKMFTDMKKRPVEVIEKNIDFYAAGVPCQSFSIAGNRAGELDPRGTLFYDAYEFIKRNRPRFFIIENVKGLISDANGETFKKWLRMLGSTVNGQYDMFSGSDSLCLGYNIHWSVINSVDHGVPQTRDRVFIVGLRDATDKFSFPKSEPLKIRLRHLLEPVVDPKYFVSAKAINFIMREDRLKKRHTQINGEIALTHTSVAQTNWTGDFICVPEATKKGFTEAENGDCINLKFGESETRRGRVGKGVAHTIEATAQLAVVVPPQIISTVEPVNDPEGIKVVAKLWNSQSGKVYDPDGIFPTLTAGGSGHGYNMGYIEPKLNKIADLYPDGNDAGRVYDPDNIACTIKSEGGGGGAKTGLYLVDQVNDNKESGGQQPYQQNRVYDSDGVMPALVAEIGGRNNILLQNRIRKLTPKECFRIMNWPDYVVEMLMAEGISDSQLYKMAGNTIVIIILKKIFANLLLNYK